MSKMFFYQRFDLLPFESADACGEPGQGDAREVLLLSEFVQRAEGVVHVFESGFATMASTMAGRRLRKKIHDTQAIRGAPRPEFARLRVLLMVEMAKVFIERRPLLTKRQRETGMEVIIGGNPVSDNIGFREKDIAGYFINHGMFSVGCAAGEIVSGKCNIGGVVHDAPRGFSMAARILAGTGDRFTPALPIV